MKKPGSLCKGIAVFLVILSILAVLVMLILRFAAGSSENPLAKYITDAVLAQTITYAIVIGISSAIMYTFGEIAEVLSRMKDYIGMIMLNQMKDREDEIPESVKDEIEKSKE